MRFFFNAHQNFCSVTPFSVIIEHLSFLNYLPSGKGVMSHAFVRNACDTSGLQARKEQPAAMVSFPIQTTRQQSVNSQRSILPLELCDFQQIKASISKSREDISECGHH